MRFRLNEIGVPVHEPDVLKWAEWYESASDGRKLVVTAFRGGSKVSTVFLGIDHDMTGQGPPLLWETMVFGGPLDGTMFRYSTKQEALEGHEKICQEIDSEVDST